MVSPGKKKKLINTILSFELQTKNPNIWFLMPWYFKSKLQCVGGKPMGATTTQLVTYIRVSITQKTLIVILVAWKKNYLKIYLVECPSIDSTALTQVISGPITGMNWSEMSVMNTGSQSALRVFSEKSDTEFSCSPATANQYFLILIPMMGLNSPRFVSHKTERCKCHP